MDDSRLQALPVLELESLAPRYSEERHGTYFAVLQRAIDEQPEVRNIALAGAYGVGKSSVLDKVAEAYEKRVIKISLLTLGTKPEGVPPASEGNPAARTTSNRIQKEIVKQLLYQQSPADAPDSRFRRITRFRWRRELLVSFAGGALALLAIIVLGIDPLALTEEAFAVTPPPWLRATASYVVVVTIVALVVLILRMFAQGRLGVEKVTAGPATITLSAHSLSYFDEYLDEIIYFFETNNRRDIVLLEDLDRFDDARIFESLHSLNRLLNSARQLRSRNIRFVYAVRDSVFEKLGRDETLATTDEARAELVRANRTKFFELIVPVVPFITHKNARDLMWGLLTERKHSISKDLVDLVARHVADMRLIHNIVNEYEVFKRRLLDVPMPVPQLDSERLFAMVVFKNTHLADFENIRQGTSSLDHLYEAWRSLVGENLRSLRAQDARLRARIDGQTGATEHAVDLAARLRAQIDALAGAPGSGFIGSDIRLDGKTIDDGTLATPAFWRKLIDDEGRIGLMVYSGRANNYSPQTMEFTTKALETLLGGPLDAEQWVEDSVARDREAIQRHRVESKFLKRHTWQELIASPQYTYAEAQSEHRTFRQWAEHLLPSRIAIDLVANGWITSYFALHVSAFYGQLIRVDAMTYVLRNVERAKADADYPLDPEDVEAILRDQGRSVLSEPSMYNVSLLDHLLVAAPDDAAVITNRLAGGGADEWEFIDHYMTSGKIRDRFVALLAPHLPGVFTYIALRAPLDRVNRAQLLDVAIAHLCSDLDDQVPREVREFLEQNYREMLSLTHPTVPPFSAERTVRFLATAGAVLPDVTGLSDGACDALAATRAYLLTAPNLERLTYSSDIALDILLHSPGEIYAYAVQNIREYLEAHAASTGTAFTVNAPSEFAVVLNSSEAWGEPEYDALVTGAHPDCRIQELEEAPHGAWPALAESRRIPATLSNVAAYLEYYDVDPRLATLLSGVESIARTEGIDNATRRKVALELVNAGGLLSERRRVSLARSIDPGTLPTSSIEPSPGSLISLLLAAGLIADDEEAFSERLMLDWETQEAAIVSSERYVDLIGPETLKPAHIAPLVRSRNIGATIRVEVLKRLDDFSGVPKDAYQAVAESALESRISLTAAGIETVREGGATTGSVLELLVHARTQITTDEVRRTLRNLGAPYAVVADKGTQRPQLTDTTTIRAILDRLKEAGVVSRYKAEKGGKLRAYLHQV